MGLSQGYDMGPEESNGTAGDWTFKVAPLV